MNFSKAVLGVAWWGMTGCSSPPATEPPRAAMPQAAPRDELRRFPREHQVSAKVVDNHLLGKEFLPGGNLATYELKNRTYQQFLIRAASAAEAATLLNEYRGHLQSPKFLAHIGGYFGRDSDQPVYLFAKDKFLAGFVGLTQEQAEPLAREFAARLY